MAQEIIDMLMQNRDLNVIIQIIIMLLSASAFGSVICITFKYSFLKSIYSKGMCISLMIMTVLSTILTNILMSNVKLALGALGALSIIRYRNVIKDPRDVVFVLWSLIVGICCGISEFVLAGIGSSFIFVVIAVMNEFSNIERFMISVIGHGNIENEIIEVFNMFFKGKAKVRVRNLNKKTTELIVELPKLSRNERNSITKSIKETLYKIDDIKIVNVFCQSEGIGI